MKLMYVLCGLKVGADLRTARENARMVTARPEVGPYLPSLHIGKNKRMTGPSFFNRLSFLASVSLLLASAPMLFSAASTGVPIFRDRRAVAVIVTADQPT